MDYPKMVWRKGRGKHVGTWQAEADSQMGKVVCTRTFTRVLDEAYVQLVTNWVVEPCL
jgi:hypothetical protein